MTDETELEFYTPNEVAKILRVTPTHVRDLIHEGELPAFKIGMAYRISKAQFQGFLNSTSTVKSSKPEEPGDDES